MELPYPKLTKDEPERFAACLNKLAAATTTTIDDAHYEAFWDTLKDLPIGAVEEAAQRLLRRDSAFLPSAGQWFTHADTIALAQWEETLAPEPPSPPQLEGDTPAKDAFFAQLGTFIGPDRAERMKRRMRTERLTYACPDCHDTGWVRGAPEPGDTLPVDRVRLCPCSPHNPVLERQRVARARRKVG